MAAMTAREVIRILLDHGCITLRQDGSHRRFMSPCGKCFTTVQIHKGKDIQRGTLGGIERDMAPCLGKNWLIK
jgi:predicted RNA binding protein YcfA (HicA-like mRNA interferase family)